MKVGISTVYDADNSGAFLQAYALKKQLESYGCEVYHIKYRTNKLRKHSYFNFDNISRITYVKRHFGFSYKNYKIYKKAIKEFNEIKPEDTQKMDLMIIGSDEVWNVVNENVLKTLKISTYKCKRKVGFAVSSGNSEVEDIKKYTSLVKSIKEMDAIFPRDVFTKKNVEEITGKTTTLVCDPTLLMQEKDYPKYKYKKYGKKYILYYGYWSDEESRRTIKKYAKENNLKVVAVGIKNFWCDDNISCHPLDFVHYVKDAEMVVTATFHGTIFALLCKKNDICID